MAVIIPKDRAAAVDGVARKVAAGAAEFVPVATVTNLARTLDVLKEQRRSGWLAPTGRLTRPCTTPISKRPLALVLGPRGAACGA